ncbi:aldehyde dehydrogenase family protein [Antrihabitans sp. YC2-6]|nr:aldehyde dehydrogenase family protein [Antrihabitans sp. YC2-6]MBJ8348257.1 aldehyde dehydrogenase family protein [Antrihabitans sp. YC2-6]
MGAIDPTERAGVLHRLADAIDDNAEELALLDVRDNGSPIREMRNDARVASAQLRYYAGLILQLHGQTTTTSRGRLNYSIRQPWGVVGRIIPFNHPFMFAASKIAAPLAAGNCVIVKPSEFTSLSALRLGELAADILPPGVLNIVTGFGAEAGDALVAHPKVRRLAFIGSAQTGRAILRRGAEINVKSITLELGGKNPLVVFPDADVDTAVEAALRGMNFTWQGQSCGSTSRLIAHAEIYDELVTAVGKRLDEMRSGSPEDEATDTGAIVSEPQLEKVLSYIAIGHEEGARLVAGGTRVTDGDLGKGRFVRPTLFADVDPRSRLAQEEIFGPVLAAMPFRTYDQALEIANNVQYGLTASVFTRDLAIAHRFAEDIEAGYVWVNDVSRHTPGTAFGGFKDSGLGREENVEELESYTQSKNVHVNFGR